MTFRYSTWLLVIGLLSVCELASMRPATSDDRQEVLIYYANETAPDEAEARNYATFVDWLRSSELDKAHAVAQGLLQDVELFPQAVDAEVATIRAQIIDLLLDLQEKLGLSHLMVSHDLSVVEHTSDRPAAAFGGLEFRR